MNFKRIITGAFLSIVFLMIFLYMFSETKLVMDKFSPENKNTFLGSVSDSVNEKPQQTLPAEPAPLNPDITATSAISVKSDLSGNDKIIFEKNSNTKLPIASLTKLMTAVIVSDNYDLSQNITVDTEADAQSMVQQDVKLGDTMPVENFLEIMLIESSNKSAYTLSEVMGEQKFVDLMNQKAKEIGLNDTSFADPTGLSAQDISTASDLVKLAEYILKNYPRLADISKSKSFDIPGFGNVMNTDELLGEIPEIVCGKTGFTNEAKGCLLLVTDDQTNGGYFFNVVLGADDRFAEMKKIVNSLDLICK